PGGWLDHATDPSGRKACSAPATTARPNSFGSPSAAVGVMAGRERPRLNSATTPGAVLLAPGIGWKAVKCGSRRGSGQAPSICATAAVAATAIDNART